MRVIRPQVVMEDDLGMVMPNGMTLAQHMAKKIEIFVRKCYKSEGRMTDDTYLTFLKGVFQTRRHVGIADHRMISVTFITDRGVGEEGVRHRMTGEYLIEDQQHTLASTSAQIGFLKESTRYCDYNGCPECNGTGLVPHLGCMAGMDPIKCTKCSGKPKGMTFILPPWIEPVDPLSDAPEAMLFRSWFRRKYRAMKAYEEARSEGWAPEQAREELPLGLKSEYVMSADIGSWWNWCLKRSAPDAHPQMRQLAIPVLRYFRQHLPQFFDMIQWPDGAWHPAEEAAPEVKLFTHKGARYREASMVVHPFYDEVPQEVVYEG